MWTKTMHHTCDRCTPRPEVAGVAKGLPYLNSQGVDNTFDDIFVAALDSRPEQRSPVHVDVTSEYLERESFRQWPQRSSACQKMIKQVQDSPRRGRMGSFRVNLSLPRNYAHCPTCLKPSKHNVERMQLPRQATPRLRSLLTRSESLLESRQFESRPSKIGLCRFEVALPERA